MYPRKHVSPSFWLKPWGCIVKCKFQTPHKSRSVCSFQGPDRFRDTSFQSLQPHWWSDAALCGMKNGAPSIAFAPELHISTEAFQLDSCVMLPWGCDPGRFYKRAWRTRHGPYRYRGARRHRPWQDTVLWEQQMAHSAVHRHRGTSEKGQQHTLPGLPSLQ